MWAVWFQVDSRSTEVNLARFKSLYLNIVALGWVMLAGVVKGFGGIVYNVAMYSR
jgi:hypothetical protein